MSGDPFFRGPFQADLLAGAEALFYAYQQSFPTVASTISFVEPYKDFFTIPGSEVVPPGVLVYSSNYVFVLMTGTQNSTQQILNIVGSAQAAVPNVPGQVGEYWASAAFLVWDAILPDLMTLVPGRRTVFLGHSLGGAIVDIVLSLFLQQFDGAPVSCFTYGAPRPGNQDFADAIVGVVTRVENDDDPICALPPPIWAGPGSNWPIPGPPPFATYVHPGNAVTVDAAGNVTPGSNPMSTLAAAALIATSNVPQHFMGSYAQRLNAKLPPEELTVDTSGFAHPEFIQPALDELLGGPSVASPSVGTPPPLRVQIFYNYGQAGISEEWFSNKAATDLRATIIPNYLQARMAMAVPQFQFAYARITNPLTPRWVDFLTPTDKGVTTMGLLGASNNIKDLPPAGAEDDGALLSRMKLTNGPSARQFLHGFDQTMTNEGEFTPNSTWKKAYAAYTNFLKNADNGILFSFGNPVGLAGRLAITGITPTFPRGYTITPKAADLVVAPGAVVYVGNVGRSVVGAKGRKIVTSVPAGGATFNVGGASPVGEYSGAGGYYYIVTPNTAIVNYMSIERLTSHRVGKPYAEPVGRKRALLSLRL
jgi:Lipase (class 3)